MLQLKSNTWKKKSIENDPYFTNVKCEERFDGNEMTVFWKAWKAIAYDNLRANLLLVETIEPRSKGKSGKPRNKKLKNNERGMKGKMTHAQLFCSIPYIVWRHHTDNMTDDPQICDNKYAYIFSNFSEFWSGFSNFWPYLLYLNVN